MNTDALRALEEGYTEAVRDPLWGHVYLTKEFAELLESAPYQKLRRIQQLGPASAVYPGATHTRAAHSIGVYHLARRLLRALLDKGADAWTTDVGAKSFLAAALLHDLGHFPFAHSLKELPLEDHETLTAKLITAEPLRTLVARSGADPYLTAAIVDGELPIHGDAEAVFFRKLLSGVLDPDKLDYLNRDARYCGVPYGAQDVDFTFSRLHPHPLRGVDVDSRGIQSVEAILFAKYLMYRSVYWHRIVRVATAMVKKSVSAGLETGLLVPEELYGLDDEGLFSLMEARGNRAFAPAAAAREARFFSIVAEFPFDEGNSAHRVFSTPQNRTEEERRLAETISSQTGLKIDPLDLIVDLPEPISFETGLFVVDEGVPFEQSSTVFRAPVVASFSRALRIVRICAAPAIAKTIDSYCVSYKNE
ncbi:MAG: HD domain-containing protein [Treponemataceae bacterium]